MIFKIIPHVGAGPLSFGMRAQEVRAALGPDFSSELKSQFAKHPTDYFLNIGAITYYDQASHLEFIELVEPAQAILDNTDMLRMNFHQALAFLTDRDPSTVVDFYGGKSDALGVGFWTSSGDEDESDPIQNVYLFRDGYYDE